MSFSVSLFVIIELVSLVGRRQHGHCDKIVDSAPKKQVITASFLVILSGCVPLTVSKGKLIANISINRPVR